MENINAMTEREIRSELEQIECSLSPENLYCDGERSHNEAMRVQRKLLDYKSRLEASLKTLALDKR